MFRNGQKLTKEACLEMVIADKNLTKKACLEMVITDKNLIKEASLEMVISYPDYLIKGTASILSNNKNFNSENFQTYGNPQNIPYIYTYIHTIEGLKISCNRLFRLHHCLLLWARGRARVRYSTITILHN